LGAKAVPPSSDDCGASGRHYGKPTMIKVQWSKKIAIDIVDMPAWLHKDSQEVKDHEAVEAMPQENKAHLSHELIVGAAAGFAAHQMQSSHGGRGRHGRRERHHHKLLVDAAAALAGGYATKLVETKGRDYWDEHHQAVSDQAKASTVETMRNTEEEEWSGVTVDH